jgi:hypothetical protein
VTLTAEGKTATFTPTTKLGYGEASIAMALAAEVLRDAGVSGCATPDQWQAALLGGPLTAASTSTTSAAGTSTTTSAASASSRFPGILTLRSQGQGWGQIAKTTNVQLGRVVSSARSSLNLGTSNETSLSPTGRSSSEINQSRSSTGTRGTSTDSSTDRWNTKGEKGKSSTAPSRDRSYDTSPSSTTPDQSSSSSSSSSYPSGTTTPSSSSSSAPSSTTTPSSSSSSRPDR